MKQGEQRKCNLQKGTRIHTNKLEPESSLDDAEGLLMLSERNQTEKYKSRMTSYIWMLKQTNEQTNPQIKLIDTENHRWLSEAGEGMGEKWVN